MEDDIIGCVPTRSELCYFVSSIQWHSIFLMHETADACFPPHQLHSCWCNEIYKFLLPADCLGVPSQDSCVYFLWACKGLCGCNQVVPPQGTDSFALSGLLLSGYHRVDIYEGLSKCFLSQTELNFYWALFLWWSCLWCQPPCCSHC